MLELVTSGLSVAISSDACGQLSAYAPVAVSSTDAASRRLRKPRFITGYFTASDSAHNREVGSPHPHRHPWIDPCADRFIPTPARFDLKHLARWERPASKRRQPALLVAVVSRSDSGSASPLLGLTYLPGDKLSHTQAAHRADCASLTLSVVADGPPHFKDGEPVFTGIPPKSKRSFDRLLS